MHIDWYFDFISPFASFQLPRLLQPPADVEVRFHPVLFAGLLNHWGQLGPVEIPAKRIFTYRYATWRARQLGVPFRMPSGHPFNSLPLLRLALAANCEPRAIERIFSFVWREGHVPDEHAIWQEFLAALERELGIPNLPARIAASDVKDALRSNTERAIAAGVFGVPTGVVDGEIFWGDDATEMMFDYCRDPAMLSTPEMKRTESVPTLASRPASRPAS